MSKKTCTNCGVVKQLDQFSPLSNGKPRPACKRCMADAVREWRKKNRDKVIAQKRRAYYRDPARKIQSIREWRAKNPEKYKAQIQKSSRTEKSLARLRAWKQSLTTEQKREYDRLDRMRNANRIRAATRKYQARKRLAVPQWANHNAIKNIYAAASLMEIETGITHEVDHVVPLVSDIVCGLHWEGNLQILTMLENRSKGNSHNV